MTETVQPFRIQNNLMIRSYISKCNFVVKLPTYSLDGVCLLLVTGSLHDRTRKESAENIDSKIWPDQYHH